MKVCRRILAGFTLLVSIAILLLSLAGSVGVWIIKEPVTARATRVFGKVETALNIAEDNLDQVKASLARAAERLDAAREEQRRLSQQRQPTAPGRRLLAREVQHSIAPQFDDAHKKLHTVAEAAIVVNSVLDDLSNFPLFSVAGLDIENLTELNDSLGNVAPRAWELSRLLSEPEPDSEAAINHLSRMERPLTSLRGWLAQFEPRVMQVRQRTDALKERVLFWITLLSILISAVLFWIALSQVSVLLHARSWWKRSSHSNAPGNPR